MLYGASVGGASVEEAKLGGSAVDVDVEGDVELGGLEDVGPEAEVDDAVGAHEPAEGHVEALEGGGIQVLGEAPGVGGAGVGGSEFAVDGLGEGPCGGGGEVDFLGEGEVGERAVAEVYATESAQVVAEVGGEECAVDVAVGEVFVALVEGVGQGLVVEEGEHAVAVAADHASVAPGDGGGK